MRLREETFFVTLFQVYNKINFSIDSFPSVAWLCISAAAPETGELPPDAWGRIGEQFCGLKPDECKLLYDLYLSLTGEKLPSAPRRSVYSFVVYLFCLLLKVTMFSSKSRLATDDAWPDQGGSNDFGAGILAYLTAHARLLLAAMALGREPASGEVDAAALVVRREHIAALALLFQPPVSSEPAEKQLENFFEISDGSLVPAASDALCSKLDMLDLSFRSLSALRGLDNTSPAPGFSPSFSPGLSQSPGMSLGGSLTPSARRAPDLSYSFDQDYDLVRVDGLARAGVVVVLAPARRPITLCISNCVNSTVYVVGPVESATVVSCRRLRLYLGTVAGSLVFHGCTRSAVTALAAFAKSTACEECSYCVTARTFLAVEGTPRSLSLGAYNLVYPTLERNAADLGLEEVCQQGDAMEAFFMGPLGHGYREALPHLPPSEFCSVVFPHRSQLLSPAPGEVETSRLAVVLPALYREALRVKSERLRQLSGRIRGAATKAEGQGQAQLEQACRDSFVKWLKDKGYQNELVETATAEVYEIV